MIRVLIAAGGGRVARRVAAALCAAGEPPRALARDPEKTRGVLVDGDGAPLPVEVLGADFTDNEAVREALEGIDIAFLALGSSPAQVDTEKAFIDAVAGAGLPHLVKLSAADAAPDAVSSVLRWHAEIESHLVTRGIPHTLISPTSFADIIMLAAPSIQANSRWSGTAAHGKNALIDSEDVVDAVVAVLRDPSKRGGRHVLSGPAGLSWLEVAEALSEALGRSISYDEVSVEERRAQLEASGLDEWRVELLLSLDEINRVELYRTPTDTVEALTGHPPRTMGEFIARHRAAFTP
jgi:NAD(P)H dehydrogenase (quinone)